MATPAEQQPPATAGAVQPAAGAAALTLAAADQAGSATAATRTGNAHGRCVDTTEEGAIRQAEAMLHSVRVGASSPSDSDWYNVNIVFKVPATVLQQPTQVLITGDFNAWGNGLPLTQAADGTYSIQLSFKKLAQPHAQLFKFVVDHEWMYDTDRVFRSDNFGNINNVEVIPGTDDDAPASPRGVTSPRRVSGSPRRVSMDAVAPTPAPAMSPPMTMDSDSETGPATAATLADRRNRPSFQSSLEFATSENPSLINSIGLLSRSVSHEMYTADSTATSAFSPQGLRPLKAQRAFSESDFVPDHSPAVASPGGFTIGEEDDGFAEALADEDTAAPGAPVAAKPPLPDNFDIMAQVSVAPAAGGAGAGAGVGVGGGGGASHVPKHVLGSDIYAPSPVMMEPHMEDSATKAASHNVVRAAGTSTNTPLEANIRSEGKLIVVMVGLPARGKTYIARKLQRHLTWIGFRTDIFNVGNYRRRLLGANQAHDFFDPQNPEGLKLRRDMAKAALDEMMEALGSKLDVAIYDATNTTKARRTWLGESVKEWNSKHSVKARLLYLESICTDDNIIRSNIRETKLKSPDYRGMPEEAAVRDFLQRIQHYVKIYETVEDDEDVAYIKLIDVNRKLVASQVHGFVPGRIMFFVSNLHIIPRQIWLTRHGQSMYNVQGLIGGDSGLSPRGEQYSKKLSAFMAQHYPPGTQLSVWTSTLQRTVRTARTLGRDIVSWKALDEINAGVCDGMTYKQIEKKMPKEFAARAADKYHYRYPAGESYQDIVLRLEPVIHELMRQRNPVLIVSHQATLRVLYAYLTDKQPSKCPNLAMPLHTLVQITPKAYGVEEVHHELMPN